MYFRLLLFFLLFCISCVENTDSTSKALHFDSFEISLDSLSNNNPTLIDFYVDEGSQRLVLYNSTIHALEFFDIEKGKLIKRLFLNYEGRLLLQIY